MERILQGTSHLKLFKPKTCLSAYVHQLITKCTISEERDQHAVDRQGLLNFSYISSKLPAMDNLDEMTYFTSWVKCSAPMMHSVEEMMDTGCHDYKGFIEWTGQAEFLSSLWELMRTPDVLNELTVLLSTVSIFERALGDLYLFKGPPPCPSMLKDLLVSSQLKDLLGEEVLQVLRVLIGPPTSLNLRNVSWHGFPAPGEIPRRCIWFIILLVPSIGKILEYNNILDISHREPVTFPDVTLITEKPILNEDDIFDTVTKSKLVHWNTTIFWTSVRQFYSQQRYSLCAALLMYHLEQSMRYIFTTVNGCEERLLTAEATTLYTTFEEMLDYKLADGTPNKIKDHLTDKIMEILLDHLWYPNGPRVRDKLGHGEASWEMFPWQLVDNLATVTIAINILFIPLEDSPKKNLKIENLFTCISNYKVQYHRIPILRNKIVGCCEKAAEIDSLIQYLPGLTERNPNVPYPTDELHDDLCMKCQEIITNLKTPCSVLISTDEICASLSFNKCADCVKLMNTIHAEKIITLYREYQSTTSEYESEVLSILEHITEETSTIVSNITKFLLIRQEQIDNKQLRSRQRNNLNKFLTSLPMYIVQCNMMCYLSVWQIFNLNRLKQHSIDDVKIIIKFWKTCLQYCENTRTCTQFDKNKWTDGVDLINKLTLHLCHKMDIL
ncbi:hypothetical protein ACF0H5_002296 [Mactra antiquata]